MPSSTGPEHFSSREALTPAAACRLEECAFSYGETYDAYLVTEGDREYFFSSGGRGVVGFQRRGRNVQVVGGLLAHAADQEELLTELIEFTRQRRWRLTFFNIGRNSFPLFQRHGFQITKLGEEPIVVLDETEWKGQSYEWLRRQEKGCQKSGVTLREIDPAAEPDYAARIAPELEEISRDHLAGTVHQREMTFFVGRFEPLALGRRRLFLAETASRIECFVVLNPCLAGSMWAIEIFRKRRDAVRGVIPFAMLQAMRRLQSEKVPFASLSLVPFLRASSRREADSFLLRAASYFMWRWAGPLYDVQGMYHFKSRFRPHWRELYIASLPGLGLTSLASICSSWGLLRASPLRLVAHWWSDWREKRRQSLAQPPWRPERIIRNLRVDRPGAAISQSAAESATAPIAAVGP